ncbi:MAG: LPS-assembly protein LptD [Calditrichaeota bacterium]|nr:LPS-assembly protein LptD [Calditrichota bacterium]MCB9391344.1 LPS-assembly protein LptD [Calditrichota bacterium]
MALWFLLCLFVGGLAHAQDSLADTTARADTVASRDGLDTVIVYSADAIDFDILTRTSILEGNARIEYKDMELTAGRILLFWDEQTMVATARDDTVFTDSTRTEVDSIYKLEPPHFKQGTEEFTGNEIAYNLKSRIGRVKGGRTSYQDGRYYGDQFKRISDDVLTVRHGEFTTCELDTPHFHFGADVLKIQVGKRVVARPVYLYFKDVPVLALPYGIFPVQRGRTSGFITPVFGESAGQGRFLRNIGYYWAASDYMDLLGTMDYYEEFGVLGGATYRYAKRYKLKGNANFDFDTQRRGASRNRRWQLAANHNHTIDQNTQVNASGAYVSDASYRTDVGTIQDQLTQSVRSNATLAKSWNNSPWTMSLNSSFTQNIQQQTWFSTLPGLRFTHKQGRIFPAAKAPKGIRFASAPKESSPPWYRTFTWTYGATYSSELARSLTFREEFLRPAAASASPDTPPSTILGDDSLGVTHRDGISHQGTFSATARLLRYLNLNPSVNWQHAWTRRVPRYEAADSLFDREEDYGFFARTTFNVGSSASTKLYGLARHPFGIPAQFRHVMTPTVGFSYRPDFSDKTWGYFNTVRLPDGREYTYDRFRARDQGGGITDTPKGLSQAMSFGLGNLFQMKHGDPEAGTEKKYDLLSANFSSGIDFKKDSLKWSDLASSFRTAIPGRLIGPFQNLGLDFSTVHSFYEFRNGRAIESFFWDRAGADLLSPLNLLSASGSMNVSLSAETVRDLFSFRSNKKQELSKDSMNVGAPVTPAMAGVPEEIEDLLPPLPEDDKAQEPEIETFADMPFSMTFDIRHARNYVSDSRTSTLSTTLNSQLTPRWSFDISHYFDLERRISQNASVSIIRDLHCWEAAFTWSPVGYSPGYYLRIGLKSPQLRDVKIERDRGGNLRGF